VGRCISCACGVWRVNRVLYPCISSTPPCKGRGLRPCILHGPGISCVFLILFCFPQFSFLAIYNDRVFFSRGLGFFGGNLTCEFLQLSEKCVEFKCKILFFKMFIHAV
jgi:hypothetical protein